MLGVAENASAEEIKRAYRKLARKHHPDRNPGDKQAEETMKTVSEAYDTLSDPKKRTEYDQMRKMARTGGFHVPNGGPQAGDAGFDVGGLFGSLFGGRAGRGAPASGSNLEAEARITFQQAMDGVVLPVRLQRDAACETCHGSGAAPGTSPVVCSTCKGSGVSGDDQGWFSFQRPCAPCGGSGRIIQTPCSSCSGDGMVRRIDEVKIRVPAGVEDGARIRARGQGGPAPRGGVAGDLYVRVRVEAHRLFGRSGADLTLDVPLTYAEAALGTEVTVPTLETPVTVRVPAGTQAGRTFRVKGRGVSRPKGGRGDLLATVRVVVPETIGAEERALLEALKEKQDGQIRSHLGV